MISASVDYIAAGGNRHPYAADWITGLLAFGAGNNVAIWNPANKHQSGIETLLTGHTDVVNTVQIFERADSRLLITGGADKSIRLWKANQEHALQFVQAQVLIDHTGSVNTLTTLSDANLFVSGGADGTVRVWRLNDAEASLEQTIILKPRFLPLTTALVNLANGDIVLAVAGTTKVIQIFVKTTVDHEFRLQATLRGHEGWVRSLDFVRETEGSDSNILLASASQDKYIRLWRFCQTESSRNETASIELVSAEDRKSLSNKAHKIGSPGSDYFVTFEALLIGHEDWIYTARWAQTRRHGAGPVLLSASADNSLSIWHADPSSGLWVCGTRLGEVSSQKGSTTATGSTGGFWIGLWQPDDLAVVSLGRTGSWRRWLFDETSSMWDQTLGICGHVKEVQGVAWAPDGSYLLSTGSDQTTRLIAEWHRAGISSWHEMARPQIHGYDLNCIDRVTNDRFISGADEKLLRVFDKPKAIQTLLSRFSGIASSTADSLPDAANVPVLGLSNKAMTVLDDDVPVDMDGLKLNDPEAVDPASVIHKSTLDLFQPPFEDQLSRHTLWPEHEKLYGHGYEISAVATSNDGSLAATACKASSIDHAVIKLYETREWREIKPSLAAHNLTITSMAFSPNDRLLLSVGRDRQFAIFQKSDDTFSSYTLLASNPKGHTRMILDCSWAPLTVDHVFATAGRDKNIKLWRLNNAQVELVETIAAATSVTAIAFDDQTRDGVMDIAYGTEQGNVHVVSLDGTSLKVMASLQFDKATCPSGTITQLRWRPRSEGVAQVKNRQLACASEDCSMRIYNIT